MMNVTTAKTQRTAVWSNPPQFHPHFLAPGPHSQTLLPYLFSPSERYGARQTDVRLPDGDTLVLHDDVPHNWQEGQRTVMLVHGLGGSHASGYMVRISAHLRSAGYRTIRMDMRGCGAGLLRARGVFHADRSDDLKEAIWHLSDTPGIGPITVCGFSLGANLTLKLLGKHRDRLPSALDSAIVVEPPIDLGRCCHGLSHGHGWIYDKYFARFLFRDFSQRRSLLRGADKIVLRHAPPTLLEFDKAITAPLAGFVTADEYYQSASSIDDLDKIDVPTAILTASDDPIIPVALFQGLALPDCVQVFISEGGGHLGFYSAANSSAPNRRWLDHQITRWLADIENS